MELMQELTAAVTGEASAAIVLAAAAEAVEVSAIRPLMSASRLDSNAGHTCRGSRLSRAVSTRSVSATDNSCLNQVSLCHRQQLS